MVIKHNNREHIYLFKDVVSFIYLNIIGKNVIDDKIVNEKRSNFFLNFLLSCKISLLFNVVAQKLVSHF